MVPLPVEVNGVKVWPVTYLMLNVLQGGAGLFLYIVAALYAGELVWRERDVRFDQIHDALPLKDWTDWLSKFTALVIVEAMLLGIVVVVGIVMQSVAGYFHFEVAQYFKELYLIAFPQICHDCTSGAFCSYRDRQQVRRTRHGHRFHDSRSRIISLRH